MSAYGDFDTSALGPNMWLIDEMYRQYRENPGSVDEKWREFFEDFRPRIGDGAGPEAAESAPQAKEAVVEAAREDGEAAARPEDRKVAARPAQETKARAPERPQKAPSVSEGSSEAIPARKSVAPPEGAERIRFAAERVVKNMQASLEVPTATSFRFIPAKLLEENRRLVNRYLAANRDGGKVSFTHLIGYAILRALEAVPAMKSSYLEVDGEPYVVRHQTVNLGLAVDVEKEDGSRTLLVPNIRGANEMDFAQFWAAYEDVIRKVRTNKLTPDDFSGTTVTLSNPGTIGTQLSVPRLMKGQGLIVATGRIDYPTEYQGADPAALAELGVGKVFGVTSTYDHRVIQGAESGLFLAKLEEVLTGGDGFYEGVFAALGIPYEPVKWTPDTGSPLVAEEADGHMEKQAHVLRLINMHRVRGHLLANLDPLGAGKVLSHPELDPAYHGLSVWDLDREFFVDDLLGEPRQTLRQVIDLLRDSYCQTVGIEYMHIQEADQKRWVQERVEGVRHEVGPEDKRHILERLNAAEGFERFLHTKYVGHKRFSLEGAESLIPMLDFLLEDASRSGVDHVVMGMAHRGRLNVLVNIVGKSYSRVFREFEGDIDPETIQGSGDVKYHVGTTGKFTGRDGATITVELASNPSHLEAVDPVVEGMARAWQDSAYEQDRSRVLPLLLHGDAAFAGQGVVAETFGMSALPGFTTGGSVHVVINNQLGFTTAPHAGRSSQYATDIAKMVQAPIFHVNGDDPEACVWVVTLAMAFRQQFRKDVVIDLVCYRRYGHNEGDDPSYTQPLMYQKIEQHRSVRKLYMESLVNRGDITVEEAEAALEDYRKRLDEAFEETKESAPPAPERRKPKSLGVLPPIQTGVDREVLDRVLGAVTSWPVDFTPHPKLAKQLERRRNMLQRDEVDWAMGEALAFGSLVLEGVPVRLTGQDSRRGTFSQRHAVLVDHRTERKWYPLANLSPDQGAFLIYDSPLNEFAALGFEYGESVVAKDALVIWEAQFGDFINEAQVIVDQFIVAGEDKWGQTSGLTLLLPHGYEGQGPEHSSARLERFLTLAAEDNIQVVVPSTPAQYFHLLRRQMHRDIRKPLVVFTPKSLLRLAAASSRAEEFVLGRFQEVLPDPNDLPAEGVRAVLLSSGKLFYELAAKREKESRTDVAIVRLEQLYPFPAEQVLEQLARSPNAKAVRWVQEEPENMGAYAFVHARLHSALPKGIPFSHVARPESASPAGGSATIHELEQQHLLERAYEGL
ncbi:MAG: multifunctional oxoglutarate decarboxylase/oxoglutarate dehydrogenase thiamine pyrophosphate-binding subunit/dihydrolipoyllysine-residue succinyltransferase subunit [Actinobacteria bacterium]|nr:MAG: multifunctional oxoglutarate decarboxylase/oxoglutarate dehydrogenase thiamine pyrophosphate-binding subunit/dihydrolipoyllysine-residue succinyltransferase subunit [Actinomycetota bacterium]